MDRAITNNLENDKNSAVFLIFLTIEHINGKQLREHNQFFRQ